MCPDNGTQIEAQTVRAAGGGDPGRSLLVENMASQIRMLSNAIFEFGNLLAKEELDEVQREYLEEIRRAGEDLPGLVNIILDRRL
jgi:hypothetical protein